MTEAACDKQKAKAQDTENVMPDAGPGGCEDRLRVRKGSRFFRRKEGHGSG